MDIYVDENLFTKFVLFMKENKDEMSRDDVLQYYDGALSNNNTKVIDYLLKEHKYIIEEDYINKSLECLTDPKYMNMTKIFNNNCIKLDKLYERLIIKYMNVLNSKYNDDIIVDYITYIVFILNNISKPSLNLIKENMNYNKYNMNEIINLIDLVILFGGRDVIIENSDDQLLFYNKDKNIKDLIKNIDQYILNIIKNELNEDDMNVIVNKLRKKNKVKFITKIKDNFYVYNDTINNWCFDNNNIQYIKTNKTNPLNGENIPDYVLTNL